MPWKPRGDRWATIAIEMPAPRPILEVGLTGGIASGKSTVAGMLADLGAFVVDADELAHLATSPSGAAYEQVVERFGREILDDSGAIDRARLGGLVFADPEARQALNSIVHPAVRSEARRRIARPRSAGSPRATP
jgi:dephospho-CoA kinase